MTRKSVTTGLAAAFLFSVSACHQLGTGREQAVSLMVSGKEAKCGSDYAFPESMGGMTGGVVEIVVRNAGDKDLSVQAIFIEDGGNAYITMDTQFDSKYFPHAIKAGDQGVSNISIKIKYTPGEQYDDRGSILVVDTDDPDVKPDGKCTLTIKPSEKKPKIKVSPPNYEFQNATPAHSEEAEFTIKNIGTQQLIVHGVTFKSPTKEFTIPDPPNKDVKIDPEGSGTPNGPVKFKVRYLPADDQADENALVISCNDPTQEKVWVTLKGKTLQGKVSVTYADQIKGYIDFTAQSNPQDTCSKVVNVLNEGPGSVTVKQPALTQDVPPGGQPAYAVAWFKGGGSQENPPCGPYKGEELISTSMFGLQAQRSVDMVVTYVAPGAQGRNGTLEINFENPYSGHVSLQMIGGAPKGQISMAPPPGNQVMFYALKGETKKRTVVVMNKGNGDLTIKDVKVTKAFDPDPDAFSVTGSVPVTMEPWSLRVFEVTFKTDFDALVVNATLDFTYVDPITGQDATLSANLEGHKDFEGVTLPVADPGKTEDYKDAKVGQVLMLDGAGSLSGMGPDEVEYAIPKGGYSWYVSAKPAGSKMFLNEVGAGATVSVLPDVTGEFEFKLVVFAGTPDDKHFYFSDEATLKVVVGQ